MKANIRYFHVILLLWILGTKYALCDPIPSNSSSPTINSSSNLRQEEVSELETAAEATALYIESIGGIVQNALDSLYQIPVVNATAEAAAKWFRPTTTTTTTTTQRPAQVIYVTERNRVRPQQQSVAHSNYLDPYPLPPISLVDNSYNNREPVQPVQVIKVVEVPVAVPTQTGPVQQTLAQSNNILSNRPEIIEIEDSDNDSDATALRIN